MLGPRRGVGDSQYQLVLGVPGGSAQQSLFRSVNLQNSKSAFFFSFTRWLAFRMVLPRAEAKLYVSVANVLLRDSIFIKTELENIKVG